MQWLLAVALALGLLSGGTYVLAEEPVLSPEFEALPEEALHLVSAGEDLHLIAAYYYGDARQWRRLFQANRERIRNPNLIPKGLVLRVPLEPGWRPKEPFAAWKKKALATKSQP